VFELIVLFLALHTNHKTTSKKKITNKKNTLKLKHLEIEWNLKKPLVFSHLHKAKERGKANTNLKSKAKPLKAWKSKGTRIVELGEQNLIRTWFAKKKNIDSMS
jgi:hypothetical protein